jgi:1-acyl-sn-glycerol-3-phosphate acyltransferase
MIASLSSRLIDGAGRVIQPELFGIDRVPSSGGFLLVGNHTLLGLQDVPVLVRELERRRGVRMRSLADHTHFAIPGWRDLLTSLGAVRGTRENCAELMRAGEPVLVFPGGAREVFKRRSQRYQLLWGDRLGFARMAIEHGYPVVPFAAVGADDTYDFLLPMLVPRPERFYFRFGAPIETTCWAGYHEDRDAQRALRDLVRAEIEDGIEFLLGERQRDPHRSLRPRLRRAVGNVVGVPA